MSVEDRTAVGLLRVAGAFVLNLIAAIFGPASIEHPIWIALPRREVIRWNRGKRMDTGSDMCCLAGILHFQALAVQDRSLGLDSPTAGVCIESVGVSRE